MFVTQVNSQRSQIIQFNRYSSAACFSNATLAILSICRSAVASNDRCFLVIELSSRRAIRVQRTRRRGAAPSSSQSRGAAFQSERRSVVRSVGRSAARRRASSCAAQSRSCDRNVRFVVSCVIRRALVVNSPPRVTSNFCEVRRAAAVMHRALSSAREYVRRSDESVWSRTVRGGACATRLLRPAVAARVRILRDLPSARRKGDFLHRVAMRPDSVTFCIANARTSLTSRRAFQRERKRDPVELDCESPGASRLGCSGTSGSWPNRSNPLFSPARVYSRYVP